LHSSGGTVREKTVLVVTRLHLPAGVAGVHAMCSSVRFRWGDPGRV